MKEWMLKKVIEDMGLPKGTKVKGYVIHLPDSDEFLADKTSDDDITGWVWGVSPEQAIKYKNAKKALGEISDYTKAKVDVCALLDLGKSYIALPIEDIKEMEDSIIAGK